MYITKVDKRGRISLKKLVDSIANYYRVTILPDGIIQIKPIVDDGHEEMKEYTHE